MKNVVGNFHVCVVLALCDVFGVDVEGYVDVEGLFRTVIFILLH